jgi:hypothetical protein
MSVVESFANGQDGRDIQPLSVLDAVAPASCFWAAFAGGALGVVAQHLVDRAIAGYEAAKHQAAAGAAGHGAAGATVGGHGHFVRDGLTGLGSATADMSGDQLLALANNRA